MAQAEPQFRTIDLDAHAALCVAFRRDSFVCSFGTAERFERESGADGSGYLEWLRSGIAEHPKGHLHVWSDDRIVGQIEMRVRPGPPLYGYINLFYIVPAERGAGLGAALHAHAMRMLGEAGAPIARLSVSPSNARALAYYHKHGWRDIGARGDGSVRLMERDLENPTAR